MKLSIKISFIIFAVFIFIIGGVGFFAFIFSKPALEKFIVESQLEIARQTVDKIDRLLARVFLDIRLIADADSLERALLEGASALPPAEKRLNEFLFTTGPWDVFELADQNGTVVYSSEEKEIGERLVGDSPSSIAFRAAIAGQAYYSDSVISEDTGKPTVIFAAPIRDINHPKKLIIGAVIGHFSWPVITEILQTLPDVAHLYNARGLIIATNQEHQEEIFVRDHSGDPRFNDLLEGKITAKKFSSGVDIPIETNIVAAAEQGFLTYIGNHWVLLYEVGTAAAFAAAVSSALRIAASIIPIAVLALGLMLFFMNRLVVIPITAFMPIIEAVTGGDLTKKVKIDSRDEIGRLASAFNSMTAKLKDLYENLDQKVQEKTSDLQKFQLAVENASDHVVITDAEGIIIYANKAAEGITGYSKSEMIGRQPSLWGGQMGKEFYERMWKTIKVDKQPFVGEFQNIKKNGQKYISESSISPLLDKNGEVRFFVEIARDVTAAKEMERIKTDFISIASHQLRTPLTSIKWISDLFLGGDMGKLTPRQKDFMEDLFSSTNRMIELINSLLNIARIESAQLEVKGETVDAVKLCEDLLKEFESKIAKCSHSVTFNKPKPQLLIKSDRVILYEIIKNLLSNAIKYTPNGGKISLSLSLKDSGELLIEVKDNGLGIPKAQLPRLFEKFFRGNNIVRVSTEGTGLGMYIVKSLIGLLGGTIKFESEENKGTVFWVTIPAAEIKERKGGKELISAAAGDL